jgi:MtN3 and saliva related transmembrane protein
MTAEWLGYAAATLTTFSFVPQAAQIMRSISLPMYLVFTIGVAFWLGYGWVLGSWPMIAANTVTFILAATILGLKLRYG